MKNALVTGAMGNLGVPVCQALLDKGYHVIGIDNDGRKETLGSDASVFDNMAYLIGRERFEFVQLDISRVDWDFRVDMPGFVHPDVIVHCAAQVSHPRSIEIPMKDFMINAYGTLHLLEFCRKYCKKVNFIHISSAKIYGQNVDTLWPYEEQATRYWYEEHYGGDFPGVNEHCSIDQTMRTPFGVSKCAADLYVQEYGKLYGLQTSVLRPGVFTGKYARPSIYQNWVSHKMYEIMTQDHVNIIGWKGKQVRDVLHCDDLVSAIMYMIQKPPPKGEVYNIGGGVDNAISVIEACHKMSSMVGKPPHFGLTDTREGDWCVYITDNSKLKRKYPEWKVTRDLDYIFEDTYNMLKKQLHRQRQSTT